MATPNDITLSTMWDDFPELQKDLNEVLTTIENTWQLNFPEIDQAVRDQLKAGKLVRPALAILFSQLSKPVSSQTHQNAIKLAASVELLHSATLIHDDIIDESKLRRGTASIQAAFGKDTAVYTGDYMLTGMFSLLSTVNKPQLSQKVIQSIQAILFGELTQKHNRYQLNMSFESYLTQITGKTAALFQLALYYGINAGNEAADSKLTKLVADFGENLGICFQLLDDYLDFAAASNHYHLGKPAGQDIRNGIYTAPILFSLEDSKYHDQIISLLELRDDITDEQLVQLNSLISETQAVERIEKLLSQYNDRLHDLTEQLPSVTLQETLTKLLERLIDRHS